MPKNEINLPSPEEIEKMQKGLEEADRLSKETLDDSVDTVEFPEGLENLELTPEMLEAIMSQQKSKPSRGVFTRTGPSHLSRDKRRRIRKEKKRARAITRNAGRGKTVSRRKRIKTS